MESIAMPVALDALSEAERRALLAGPAMATLQGVFAAAPDPRKRRGRRYDLPFLLTCLVGAPRSRYSHSARRPVFRASPLARRAVADLPPRTVVPLLGEPLALAAPALRPVLASLPVSSTPASSSPRQNR